MNDHQPSGAPTELDRDPQPALAPSADLPGETQIHLRRAQDHIARARWHQRPADSAQTHAGAGPLASCEAGSRDAVRDQPG